MADALKDAGLHEDALRYYRPLRKTDEYADVGFFMAMGECCMALGRFEEAEECYLVVAEGDLGNVESRVQLAKLYELIGMTEQAFKYINEAVVLGRQASGRQRKRKDARLEHLAREFQAEDGTSPNSEVPTVRAAAESLMAGTSTSNNKKAAMTASSKRGADVETDWERTEHIRFLYSKMMQLRPKMDRGDIDATEDWLDIADALLRDFRSNRVFYPLQRSMVFSGYSRDAQRKAGKQKGKNIMDEAEEMADRLQESLGELQVDRPLVDFDSNSRCQERWLRNL